MISMLSGVVAVREEAVTCVWMTWVSLLSAELESIFAASCSCLSLLETSAFGRDILRVWNILIPENLLPPASIPAVNDERKVFFCGLGGGVHSFATPAPTLGVASL